MGTATAGKVVQAGSKRLLLLILFTVFISFLGMGIVTPLVPVFATQLGASGVALGFMVAAFSLASAIIQPIVGNLSDKYGRKRFFVIGLSVYTIASFAYALAVSIYDLTIIRVFHGVGSAMIMPLAMAYIGDISPKGREGTYMGYYNMALLLGFSAGPTMAGAMADTWGLDTAFYSMGGLSAGVLLMIMLWLPWDRGKGTAQVQEGLISAMRKMSRSRRVMGIILSRFMSVLVFMPFFSFLPVLMHQDMGATSLQIGLAITIRDLTSAAFQPPFGRLADKHSRVALTVVGILILCVFTAATALAQTVAQVFVLAAVTGMFQSVALPAMSGLAVEEGRNYGMGSVMGVFNMAASGGIFVAGMVFGLLMDSMGIRTAFVVGSGIAAAGTLVAGWMIQTGKRTAALSAETQGVGSGL